MCTLNEELNAIESLRASRDQLINITLPFIVSLFVPFTGHLFTESSGFYDRNKCYLSVFFSQFRRNSRMRAEMDNHLLVFRCVEQLDHDWLLFAYISSNFDKRISVTRFEMVI